MEEDIEDRDDTRAEIITNGLISFQKFLKEFKQVVKDDVIEKINNKFEISYNFRKFNLECFIIDKKYYDEFCKAINYKEISKVLSIINEESTEKCKQMVKDKLKEENFNFNVDGIEFYADQEELKKIVGHFNNYSFLNKEILVECMGVPEEKLKSKKIYVSKNEKNTTLLNIEENFTMSINITKKDSENKEEEIKKEEEKKVQIKKKPKNLYYVEDITKRIFLLLYKKDELLNEKIQKDSKDSYKFKNYYLISKEWLKSYKENFLYDQIINKLDEEIKSHSYKRIKTELNSIIKDKIGQVKLYGSSEIEPGLREASKLLPQIKPISENKDNNLDFVRRVSIIEETLEPEQDLTQSYEVPSEFEIINEDIYELLKKEEFLENYDEKIENQLCYQILFGNKWMIIKNKASENFEEKDDYSNELLFYRKNVQNENNNENYLLQFILNFEKKVNFYEEIKKIFSNGAKKYINNTKINLESNCTQEKILDENSNVLGKIFNVNINLDMINDEIKDNNGDISNDNIIQNINEIKLSNINKDENEYNFNQNKINYKDEDENKIILDNDFKYEEEKDYSVEDIQKKLKSTKNLLNSIIGRIYNNRPSQTQLELNSLESEELDKILSKSENINGAHEIILMNEEKYKVFNAIYHLDELKNIFADYKQNKNERRNILEKNREKFIKLLNRIKNNKYIEDNNFQLNDDYETCINNINENIKFALLSATDFQLTSENKNNLIYYFIYKNETYIFFKKEKKILKVKYENINSEFCDLEVYKAGDINKITEYLNSLKQIREKFKNRNYDELKDPINEYYLINNKWIEYAENQLKENNNNIYNEETFKPKYNINSFGHNYPSDFFIVIKEEKNKLMMDNLINYFEVKDEEIIINKILIEQPNYICLLNNSMVYFFAFMKIKDSQKEKEILDLSFFITFTDKITMEKEINKISLTGVELYINLMFLSNKEPYKIYDMKFNTIGSIININQKNSFIKSDEYSYRKPDKSDFIKVDSLFICLSNIKELKDFIPKRNNEIVIKDKNNQINLTFLINFFAVLRIIKKKNTKFYESITNTNIILEEYDDVYQIFLTQIQELTPKENENNLNIFNCLNLLTKIIILELQKQLYLSETKNNFNYDDKKVFQSLESLNIINNKKTMIQQLFFFEMEITKKSCKCKESKSYQIKYYLEFNLNENDKDSKNITDLFINKLKKTIKCEICQKDRKIKRKLISLPEYLIIIVNETKKNIMTVLDKKINIKNICNINKIPDYELISFIESNNSPIIKSDDKWKGCNSEIVELSKGRKIPNLLIYKQIKEKK